MVMTSVILMIIKIMIVNNDDIIMIKGSQLCFKTIRMITVIK